jgi:stress-induced morphogen
MANEALKKKVYDVLRDGYFNARDDSVDVSNGYDDFIHVVIVSRKFDGKYADEKEELIWSQLNKFLTPEEWGRITLSIGVSPEEIKAA